MAKLFIRHSRVDRETFVRPLMEHLWRVYRHQNVCYDKDLRGEDRRWEKILRQIDWLNMKKRHGCASWSLRCKPGDERKSRRNWKKSSMWIMSKGLHDAKVLTQLYGSIKTQAELTPKRKPRARWTPAIPRLRVLGKTEEQA
jgi:hypothetical protein